MLQYISKHATVHHKTWACNRFSKFCRPSHDWVVAGSLFHNVVIVFTHFNDQLFGFVFFFASVAALLCVSFFVRCETNFQSILFASNLNF